MYQDYKVTLFTVLVTIENLTLVLCIQALGMKEQVKVSKCQKSGDLILKTVTLVTQAFKNKNYAEILKKNV